MIKVGMNLLLWSDDADFETHRHLLDYCKECGFDGVEFNVGVLRNPADCTKFGAYAKQLGLDVTTVGTFDPGVCNPISPDPAQRASTYGEFKKFVDMTVALGGTLLCGPLYQALGYFTGARPTAQEWKWSIETMKPCFAYAKEKGITVAVEPLNRFESYLLNTCEDAIRYVREIDMPHVGLLVDTMHANVEELDVAQAFRNALPYTKHVHISENNRGIPGTGHACSKEILAVYQEGNYDGYLTIEAFNLGAPSLMGALHLWRTFAPNDNALAKQGHDYIRAVLNQK